MRISSGRGGKSFDSRDLGVGRFGAGVAGRVNDGVAVENENDGDVDDGEKAEINGGAGDIDDDNDDSSGEVDGLESVGGAGNEDVGGGGGRFASNDERKLDGGLKPLLKR